MNINIVINGITSEQMFDEMIRELKLVRNKNQLLKRIGVRWKNSGRVSDPLSDYIDMRLNVENESAYLL
jgi:mannitol/fructose-specific phosphotransferase system IIA component (Ntr-type)|tara:strand:+ start:1057 stop:1263 length:207 start_codon:yes stop_codon:yes gene_type:complete